MEIINKAIEQLINQTGLVVRLNNDYKINNQNDACLDILLNDVKYKFIIELKNNITTNYLIGLQPLVQNNINVNYIVITDYANAKIREMAQKAGLNYLDTAGNAYIKLNNLFVKIDGKHKIIEAEKQKNRAFTNTGLKVLFYFLYNPENVNKTIREIAAETTTALDTVHKTINALIQMKFLMKVNNNEYQLIKYKELLDLWIHDYEIKLKNKLYLGTFRFAKKDDEKNWRTQNFMDTQTLWGGENAGAILTNYLNPEIFTIYTELNKNELAMYYHILPDTNGKIKIYTKFWKFEQQQTNIVPALLVYADLINTGDDRCIETAKNITDEIFRDRF